MSKKSQKKKRGVSSLIKFLKNRKHAGVALGICLAIAASAYVATAKFSANAGTEVWDDSRSETFPTYWIKFIDKRNNPIVGLEVKETKQYVNNSSKLVSLGKTDKLGRVKEDSFLVCQSEGKKRLCEDKEHVLNKALLLVMSDGKAIDTKRYISGTTVASANPVVKVTDKYINDTLTPQVTVKETTGSGSGAKVTVKEITPKKTVLNKIATKAKSVTKTVTNKVTSASKSTTKQAVSTPAGPTGIIKNFVIRRGTRAGLLGIQLEGKKCQDATSATTGGCSPQVMTFNQACNGAGECVLGFTVVNVPKVDKNGRKTDQFFLTPNQDKNFIIKKIVVPGTTAGSKWASVSVSFPIGSTIQKSQSYKINNGKQISIKDKVVQTTNSNTNRQAIDEEASNPSLPNYAPLAPKKTITEKIQSLFK